MDELKSGSKVDSILSEAARTVEQATEAVSNQATRATENVDQARGEFDRAIRDSLRRQPMATLSGVVVLGFVLGALWKS